MVDHPLAAIAYGGRARAAWIAAGLGLRGAVGHQDALVGDPALGIMEVIDLTDGEAKSLELTID